MSDVVVTSPDPTENVRELTDAANKRQDDLRAAQDTLTTQRVDSLRREVDLRAEHAREIRELESDRLEKIRQVDVLAGNTAADRALVAIQTLATVTAGNAETLRAMVASTATTIAAQLDQRLGAVTDRIAALEKSSYTGMGKSLFADPAMADLVNEMKSLIAARAGATGKSEGISATGKLIVAAIGLIATLVGLLGGVAALYFMLRGVTP